MRPPLRIWLFPSAFPPHRGGVEELTLKLARHLQERGHEVLVVTNRWPESLPAVELVESVPCRRVRFVMAARHPRTWLPAWRHRRDITDELTRLGPAPDVVHVMCASSQTWPAALFARRHGVPLVITTQGETVMDAQHVYDRNPWQRRDLRRASAEAAALTACSSWTRDQAARLAPAFATAEVIFNGVEAADWPGTEEVAEPVLVAWGRHVPQKGFDLLLEALPLVVAARPGTRLLLGGAGTETERLRTTARGAVDFLGPLDRAGVQAALARGRVAVVPSRLEPFGIVAVEALAAGKGLVYSTVGGLGEAAGGRGRGADPTDTRALADAIIAELDTPTPAESGRDRARELGWSELTTTYETVYYRHARPSVSRG